MEEGIRAGGRGAKDSGLIVRKGLGEEPPESETISDGNMRNA